MADKGVVIYKHEAINEGSGESDFVVSVIIGDIIQIEQGGNDCVLLLPSEFIEIGKAIDEYLWRD